jgi:hypothetical protein
MSSTDLVERVNRDPALNGDEKETTITMYGQDKHFQIFSAKPTVVKSLLKHNHFELRWARLMEEDNSVQRITERETLEKAEGDIVAISGEMPVGVLTVKSAPRTNNHQSSIISTETIDPSVFED